MKRRLPFTVALAVALALQFGVSSNAETTVTTLTGTGVTGTDDGPQALATFMLPMGIAYDRAGNAYVADAAGQRIRRVAPDGSVRTLAGGGIPDASRVWVPGGYADGPGDRARFNRPAAVAVGPDGRVYIADSYNHCVRVMTPGGDVSTFAGSPAHAGYRRESRAAVEFQMPAGLAFDRAGNLLVVDTYVRGAVVRIAPNGTVDQIAAGDVQPGGAIAVYDSAAGQTLFLGDLAGMVVRRADGTVSTYRNAYRRDQCAGRTAPSWLACDKPYAMLRNGQDIGMPSAIAAFDDHCVAYTDDRSNAVRFADFKTGTGRVIAGYALSDATAHGGGHADGAGSSATFNAPLGIAIAPDGSLAVGDGGSRRVRLVRNVDLRQPLFASDVATARASNAPAIALAGDAGIWQGADWPDSVAGRLQRHLNAGACARCGSAVVSPLVLAPLAAGLSALTAMPQRRFDAIVLALNARDASELAGTARNGAEPPSPASSAALVSALRRLDAAVKARGSHLVVVVHPLPGEIDPASVLVANPLGVDFTPVHGADRLHAALTSAGITAVDASSEFAAARSQAVPPALYDPGSAEFASGGREALAAAAARALLALKAW